jgi:hypothetical protein
MHLQKTFKVKMTNNLRKFFNISLIVALTLFPLLPANGMQSTNYAIDQDSINFGGTDNGASNSYKLSDTMGEVGAGENSEKCSSMSFDGTDDYVKVADASSLNISGDYTISLWVYNQAGAKTYPTLLNRAAQSTSNGFFWIYTGGTNGADVNFQYANGTNYVTTSFVGALGLNVWNDLTFTFSNSSKTLTLYVDGQLFNTTRTLTGALPVDDGDLYLGTYQATATNYPFYGYLDDVRLYTRTLSSAEASDLYKGKQISSTNLAGYWGFDEGSGTTSADLSGNGNTATAYNGAVFYQQLSCRNLQDHKRRIPHDVPVLYFHYNSP